ncbi:copper resistance protein CopC [Agromyces atrinae]|uniref:Copper resistance protein CopC n=1 Tax=Agromyces atrinae TaxID=592376 RepID=A0A4Q2M7N4_9MICO|nr:copper resistance CopC family protein [Agromyces atrinae]MCI2956199.1 copper resistance protein CopC [Agromyces atrinae]NYD68391.1 hypothetical protein [Agromyces atrinae]RXZ85140.1 copper resistance protein CopC [Agromyces atrinae]
MRVIRVAGVFAASALLIGLSAMPASAHNYVVGSSPEQGAVVTTQPGFVSLTTNDALIEGGVTVMEVTGPDGLYYGDGCATIDGPTVSMDAELGAAGEYTVAWQVVSTDGHPISDEFTFDWQPAEGETLAEGVESAPTCADGTDPQAGDAAEAEGETDAPAADAGIDSGVLWIGGAVLFAALAALITWLLVRRRP